MFLYLVIQPLKGLGSIFFIFSKHLASMNFNSYILFTFKSFGFDLLLNDPKVSNNVSWREKIT